MHKNNNLAWFISASLLTYSISEYREIYTWLSTETHHTSNIQRGISENDWESAGVPDFSFPPDFRALHAWSNSSVNQIMATK